MTTTHQDLAAQARAFLDGMSYFYDTEVAQLKTITRDLAAALEGCYALLGDAADKLTQVNALEAASVPPGAPEGYETYHLKGFAPLWDALVRAHRKGYMPDAMIEEWENFDALQPDALSAPSPAQAPVVQGEAIDSIVSSLYRRFKDWSKRGFGPDDVTWCEVRAEVVALLATTQAAEQREPLTIEQKRKLLDICGFVTGPNFQSEAGWRYRSIGTPSNVWEGHLFELIDRAAAASQEKT